MSRASHGTMEILLGDKSYTLKASMGACDRIEKRFGGITEALEAAGKMNVTTLATIIDCGANVGQSNFKDLKEAVFEHGILNTAPIVVEFLSLLLDPTGKGNTGEDSEQGED